MKLMSQIRFVRLAIVRSVYFLTKIAMKIHYPELQQKYGSYGKLLIVSQLLAATSLECEPAALAWVLTKYMFDCFFF